MLRKAVEKLSGVLELQARLTELQLIIDEGSAWIEETASAEQETLLRGAAVWYAKVLALPPPDPLLPGFGDSALDFSLRFGTGDFEHWMAVQSDVLAAVERALREAGVAIPFPQRDLHLRSVDPGVREALGAEPRAAREPGPSAPPAGPGSAAV